MKKPFLLLLSMTAIAAPAPKLEPRVHFVHEWEGGDALRMYYEIPQPLVPNDPFGTKPSTASSNEIKSITVTGLPLKSWRIVDAFGKRNIELEVNLKAGLDVTFSSLKINSVNVSVAPSRVLYLKPLKKYPLSYEKLQQQPTDTLFLAMQIFNDSPDTIFVDKLIYAPIGVTNNQVLVTPKFDSNFFSNIETWVNTGSKGIPVGLKLENSNLLNLKILPSRGFGAAIISSSLKNAFNCKLNKRTRDASKRYDTFISQPLFVYRVGNGKPQFFPIPDQIVADICP